MFNFQETVDVQMEVIASIQETFSQINSLDLQQSC